MDVRVEPSTIQVDRHTGGGGAGKPERPRVPAVVVDDAEPARSRRQHPPRAPRRVGAVRAVAMRIVTSQSAMCGSSSNNLQHLAPGCARVMSQTEMAID
jgi:hypothetical protein